MDLYDQASMDRPGKSNYRKLGNYEKAWTKEDEELLKKSHIAGRSFKEIGAQLGRGANGVRLKLVNLGLIDEAGENNLKKGVKNNYNCFAGINIFVPNRFYGHQRKNYTVISSTNRQR